MSEQRHEDRTIPGNVEGEPTRELENPTIVYIDLMRHSNRFAGKGEWTDPESEENIKFDDTQDLTPAGKERAFKFGKEQYPDMDYVVGVASFEPRASETAADIRAGAQKDPGLGASRVFGMSYGDVDPKNYAKVKGAFKKINEIASRYLDYGRLDPENRATVRQEAQEHGLRDIMNNEEYVQDVAESVAYNVWALKEISTGAVAGSKTALPFVSHGSIKESFLKKALVVEDVETGEKNIGFDNIDEIGGFFKNAESFRIKISRGNGKEDFDFEFTDPERQKLFEHKKIYLDWGVVEDLYKRYEKKNGGLASYRWAFARTDENVKII